MANISSLSLTVRVRWWVKPLLVAMPALSILHRVTPRTAEAVFARIKRIVPSRVFVIRMKGPNP